MKRFLTIALLCLGVALRLSCQTNEETMLFNKINAYRDSLGLKKLVWDASAYKMASHHSKYITIINSTPYKKGIVCHSEDIDNIDIPDFKELSFDARCNEFIKKDYLSIRENCAIDNITSTFSSKSKIQIYDSFFSQWFKSNTGHKENMESKDVTRGACSIQYYTVNMEFKLSSGKIKNKVFNYAVAVLNLY